LEACFSLIETTSSADYKASRGGWHPDSKRLEMKDKDMKYLLVKAMTDEALGLPTPMSIDQDNPQAVPLVDSPLLAYLSFQLTLEPPYTVLYIYEIHLVTAVRRMGLGAFLMSIAERIAQAVGVDKTMLTVFTRNQGAFEFYKSLGYGTDIISPRETKLRGGKVLLPDYAILSKSMAEN
jgi:N-alpha-acetyltransferase 40